MNKTQNKTPNKMMKAAVIAAAMLAGGAFAGDLITVAPVAQRRDPAGDRVAIMSSALSTGQVVEVWTALSALIQKPACATNSHVTCMNFVLLDDGTARVTWVWEKD